MDQGECRVRQTAAADRELPQRLYKYLPPKFAPVVLQGRLLFRNLAYFRQAEDLARGDLAEGMHIDQPDTPIVVESLDGKIRRTARAFHNEIDQERVFSFCISTALRESLCEEFGGAIVEIVDVPAFLLRVRASVRKYPSLRKSGLICGPVEYYRHNSSAIADDKDSRRLPFFKAIGFAYQEEYRLVCSQRRGLTLRQSLVSHSHSLGDEAARLTRKEKVLTVGDLNQIARLVKAR